MNIAENTISAWKRDLCLALLAMLVAFAVNAAAGFPTLIDNGGDNDSLLRLVEVRDLLAGQNWFDLTQYRMGPEGGFLMHWSRLVDAPIAAIILVASALTGSMADAEAVAKILWPAACFGTTLFILIRATRIIGGEGAVLPATIIGASALYFIGIFDPGALDHHNIQLALTMASVAFLLGAPKNNAAAYISGICAALTLAVGMETAPYVAAIGLSVAGFLIFGSTAERPIAKGFGIGFAGAAAITFISTVQPAAWGEAYCDAFSTVQLVVAVIAGVGLALVASLPVANHTTGRCFASLVVLGGIIAAVVKLKYPECLAAPYANLDPRLRELWLDHISEARSVFTLIAEDPASVVGRYATPLLALFLMMSHFRRGSWRRHHSVVAAILATAFAVSIWQVRGSTFAVAFAVIPLSIWVASWRERASVNSSLGFSLKMVAAWLVSLNVVWIGVAAAAATAFENQAESSETHPLKELCDTRADLAALAALPETTVLATSNMGSPILVFTTHRVLAGPYHRNVDGNLIEFDAFMGSASAARVSVMRHHVGLIAICRNNPDTNIIVEAAPDGFLAQLLQNEVPGWLQPIAETIGSPLELYRVRTEL